MTTRFAILTYDDPLFKATVGDLLAHLKEVGVSCDVMVIAQRKSLWRRFVSSRSKTMAVRKAVARIILPPLGRSSIAMSFEGYRELLGPELVERHTRCFEQFVAKHPERVILTNDLGDGGFLSRMKSEELAVGFVEGAGLLRTPILETFSIGVVNLHGSGSLPQYRGLGSVEMAIIDGNPITLNLHYVDEGIDTGDIIRQKRLNVAEIETLSQLYAAMFRDSRKLIAQTIADILAGKASRKRQQGGSMYYMVHPLIEAHAEILLATMV